MFSTRTPKDLTPNRLTDALNAAGAEGRAILDLTLSNPTRAGLEYPSGLLRLLADSRGALLWAHQIEALYDLFEPQLSSAHVFRIYVSKKKEDAFRAEAFEEARGMIFPDGRSLADIVQERMIFGITKHLNARSASILMPHLSGVQGSGRVA